MITGKKIRLRSIQQKDINSINSWRNDLEVKQNALLHSFPVSITSDEKWFESLTLDTSNARIYFSIEIIESNTIIGFCSLSKINWVNRNASFGIIIGDKTNRGKGFGEETTRILTKYAFENLGLVKIYLEVNSNNNNAINLYNKVGFETEGIMKKHYFFNNRFYDVILMAILNKKIC